MRKVDLAAQYCSTRRNLEERGWALTSRLYALTERLLRAIGKNHEEFASLKQECRVTRADIAQAQHHLYDHRSEHGC
jgi:hypothetical protein